MFTFWFYIDSDRQKWGENILCNHKITHFGAVTFRSQLCSDEQGPILHRTCSLPLLPTARSHALPPAPDLPMQLQPAVLPSCSLCPRCRAAGTSSLAKCDPHWGVVPFLYPGASFVAFSFFADGSLHFLAFPFRPRMVSFCLLKQAALPADSLEKGSLEADVLHISVVPERRDMKEGEGKRRRRGKRRKHLLPA